MSRTRVSRVPASARLLSVAADLLDLRTQEATRKILNGRTAQRYFAGERDPHVVKASEVDAIRLALAEAVLERAKAAGASAPPSITAELVARAIANYSDAWDAAAGSARHARGAARRGLILGPDLHSDAFLTGLAAQSAAWMTILRAWRPLRGPAKSASAREQHVSPLGARATSSLLRRLFEVAVRRTARLRRRRKRDRPRPFSRSRLADGPGIRRGTVADLLDGQRAPHGATVALLAETLWEAIVDERSPRHRHHQRVASALRGHYAMVALAKEAVAAFGETEGERLAERWLLMHRRYVHALAAAAADAAGPERVERFWQECWMLLLHGTSPIVAVGFHRVATAHTQLDARRFAVQEFVRHLGLTLANRVMVDAGLPMDGRSVMAAVGEFGAGVESALAEERARRMPNDPALQAAHAAALADAGLHADAVPVAERVLDLAPEDWRTRAVLAEALLKTARTAEAEAQLVRLELVPDAAHDLATLRGHARLAGGDPDAALAAYRVALLIEPADPVALAGAAECERRLGHPYEARRLDKAARKLGVPVAAPRFRLPRRS